MASLTLEVNRIEILLETPTQHTVYPSIARFACIIIVLVVTRYHCQRLYPRVLALVHLQPPWNTDTTVRLYVLFRNLSYGRPLVHKYIDMPRCRVYFRLEVAIRMLIISDFALCHISSILFVYAILHMC
jgi:hypothetical protein